MCLFIHPGRLWPEVASFSFQSSLIHPFVNHLPNHFNCDLHSQTMLPLPPPPQANPDSGATSAPSQVRTYRVWQGSNVSRTQLSPITFLWFIFTCPSFLCHQTPSWLGICREKNCRVSLAECRLNNSPRCAVSE